MKYSTDRILTTHVGSLPRPEDLLNQLQSWFEGGDQPGSGLGALAAQAVLDVVARQVETGLDIVSDGEMGKISYTQYVKHRLNGIGERGEAKGALPLIGVNRDYLDHPDYKATRINIGAQLPICIGPVSYGDREPVERDIANFQTAIAQAKPVEGFLNAASPGVLTKFVPDGFYRDEDRYVADLAEAMSEEYEAIHQAGLVLQIDCPDLGSARHNQYQDLSEAAFLKIAERNVEALNHATRNIPAEAMRMHVCWGNYEGPHTHDIALAAILPVCMKARPQALLFEGANPRHEHEWEDLAGAQIPDDKILVPGVIDSTTNFVEHPRLIAQRIQNHARVVGRERVIAGTDCGFATFAGPNPQVAPSIVWAKLRALAEGAAIASDALWSG